MNGLPVDITQPDILAQVGKACHNPKGVKNSLSCSICHDIHDMGDWLNKTNASYGVEKVYGWYNASDPANYTMMDNTTELCGKCHYNGRSGRTVPGWSTSASTTPISPHYQPLDMFMGSPKQTGEYGVEFESVHAIFIKIQPLGMAV